MNPGGSKNAYRRYLVISLVAGFAMAFAGALSIMRHVPYDETWGILRFAPVVYLAVGLLTVVSRAYRLWRPRNPRPFKFEHYRIT